MTMLFLLSVAISPVKIFGAIMIFFRYTKHNHLALFKSEMMKHLYSQIKTILKSDELVGMWKFLVGRNTRILEALEKEERSGNIVFVISATPQFVLNKLIASNRVYGSITNDDWRIVRHNYGREKLKLVKTLGFDSIKRYYTDSPSDYVFDAISKERCLVKGGHIHVTRIC